MGLSKKHASTVPLVLNPETGYITPQYHIVFDDWFAAVATNADALPDFNTLRWARLLGDSRYQFPSDEGDDNKATEEARMDSQATDAINENQTRVTTAMDQAVAVDQLPFSPPAETQLTTPTLLVLRPPPPTTPLMTPSLPTPMSQTREQPFTTHLQSPPTSDIRNSSPRHSDHTRIQQTESPQRNSPATPTSPPCQPVFSPVQEHTLRFETRENQDPDSDTPERHLRHPSLRAAPAAFAHRHSALDTTALKDTVTLHLQVLGSLKKMELSCLQLPSGQHHLTLTSFALTKLWLTLNT